MISNLLYRLFYSSVVLMVSWFPRLVNPMLDNFCSCNNQERLHQCSWAWVSQVKTMMILCKLLWQKWHLQVSYGGCSVITKLNLFRILKVKDLLSSQNYGLFMKFWGPKKKDGDKCWVIISEQWLTSGATRCSVNVSNVGDVKQWECCGQSSRSQDVPRLYHCHNP